MCPPVVGITNLQKMPGKRTVFLKEGHVEPVGWFNPGRFPLL